MNTYQDNLNLEVPATLEMEETRTTPVYFGGEQNSFENNYDYFHKQQNYVEQPTFNGQMSQNQYNQNYWQASNMAYMHPSPRQFEDIKKLVPESSATPQYNLTPPTIKSTEIPPHPQSTTDLPKRVRTVYTWSQLRELEKEFALNEFLRRPRKIQISQRLNLTEKQVKIWFANRRMKLKKQKAMAISQNYDEPSSPSTQSSDNSISPPNCYTPVNQDTADHSSVQLEVQSFLGNYNYYNNESYNLEEPLSPETDASVSPSPYTCLDQYTVPNYFNNFQVNQQEQYQYQPRFYGQMYQHQYNQMENCSPQWNMAYQYLHPSLNQFKDINTLVPSESMSLIHKLQDSKNQLPQQNKTSSTKKRTVYTSTQFLELEKEFKLNKIPSRTRKIQLSQNINIDVTKIEVWFQNRRMKWKKEQRAKSISPNHDNHSS